MAAKPSDEVGASSIGSIRTTSTREGTTLVSDQQQNFNTDDALNKAKDYAKENPEQARGAIDKLEQARNEKTGGPYKDVIEKGGEYLEKAFGIPSDVSNHPPEPAPGEGNDPGTPAPTPEPAPSEPQPPTPSQHEPRTDQPAGPAPSEQPAPADPDAAPPSTPDDAPTTPDDGTSPKTLPPFGN